MCAFSIESHVTRTILYFSLSNPTTHSWRVPHPSRELARESPRAGAGGDVALPVDDDGAHRAALVGPLLGILEGHGVMG